MELLKSNLPLEGPINDKELIGRMVYLIEGMNDREYPIFMTGYIRNVNKSDRKLKVKFPRGEEYEWSFKYFRLVPEKVEEFKEEMKLFQKNVDDLAVRLAYMEKNAITRFNEKEFTLKNTVGKLKQANSDDEIEEILNKTFLLAA